MDTFWNSGRKKKRKELEKNEEYNEILIKDGITRDIRTIFEQVKDYYQPKRANNFWNNF